MHVLLHAGLDPASKLFGFCWLDGDGKPLLPLEADQDTLRSFVTLRGTKDGKEFRNIRLDQIEDALWDYLRTFPKRYFDALSRVSEKEVTWEIASFSIEEPSDNYHKANGQSGGDRHDTGYVNGMSARMAYTVCRGYAREQVRNGGRAIPIFNVSPSNSSANLGVGSRAAKWQRCSQVATLGGGQYVWRDMDVADAKARMKYSGEGWCEGGALHGANADALDAGSAAWSGRHNYITAWLVQMAKEADKLGRKKAKAPKKKPIAP